ncbi:hypothetical protein BDV12DRAFT_194936 [Aspergillus spectabilis]
MPSWYEKGSSDRLATICEIRFRDLLATLDGVSENDNPHVEWTMEKLDIAVKKLRVWCLVYEVDQTFGLRLRFFHEKPALEDDLRRQLLRLIGYAERIQKMSIEPVVRVKGSFAPSKKLGNLVVQDCVKKIDNAFGDLREWSYENLNPLLGTEPDSWLHAFDVFDISCPDIAVVAEKRDYLEKGIINKWWKKGHKVKFGCWW